MLPPGRARLATNPAAAMSSWHACTTMGMVFVAAPTALSGPPHSGTTTVPGAIAIQQVYERVAWAGRYADPAAHAPRVGALPVLILSGACGGGS